MPDLIPFTPSDNNYTIVVPISSVPYVIDVRFNSVDSAWYMDLYEEDRTPVLMNIKLVLGARIGSTCAHVFFKTHSLTVVDTAASGTDASFDDLGNRIQVQIVDTDEVIAP